MGVALKRDVEQIQKELLLNGRELNKTEELLSLLLEFWKEINGIRIRTGD